MNLDTTWPTGAATPRRSMHSRRAATAGGSLQAAVIASAMVATGFGLSVAMLDVLQSVAMPLAGWVGMRTAFAHPPASIVMLAGLIIGTALAAHALHREHANPLGGEQAGAGYGYTAAGRRRMAIGLAFAYVTGATLVLVVAWATDAWAELARLLAY
jgi:hypothetical protein